MYGSPVFRIFQVIALNSGLDHVHGVGGYPRNDTRNTPGYKYDQHIIFAIFGHEFKGRKIGGEGQRFPHETGQITSGESFDTEILVNVLDAFENGGFDALAFSDLHLDFDHF